MAPEKATQICARFFHLAAQNANLQAISQDQNRLRENMRVLERSPKLYQSYKAKLGAQKERIAKIAAQREFNATVADTS